MIFLSFILTYFGFVFLSLAMKRHYLQVKPKQNQPSKWQVFVFQLAGSVCLIASCILCVVSDGMGVGLVYWVGLLTVSAFLLSLLFTYKSQWILFR